MEGSRLSTPQQHSLSEQVGALKNDYITPNRRKFLETLQKYVALSAVIAGGVGIERATEAAMKGGIDYVTGQSVVTRDTVERVQNNNSLDVLIHGQNPAPQRFSGNVPSGTSRAFEKSAIRSLDLPMFDEEILSNQVSSGNLIKIPQKGIGYVVKPMGSGYEHREMLNEISPDLYNFILDVGHAFDAQFPGRTFKITSLTRTKEYQALLGRNNGNATADSSSHMTGHGFDISYASMTEEERLWFENLDKRAAEMEIAYIIKERKQSCYHGLVFPGYKALTEEQREEMKSFG